MKKNASLKTFILLFIITFFTELKAKDLYFAGFTFMGNADQNFRYPVADKLFKENNLVFKEPLDSALLNFKRSDLNLIYDLGSSKQG